MPQTITLNAQLRTVLGNKVRALRRSGQVPAVVYGHNAASQSLAVEARAFEKAYKQAGESTLVDLAVAGGAPVKVLIHEVAKDPLTLKPIHVDFYQVSMTEKLTAEVPLKFIGEAPAVKELGAILVKNIQAVKVECLPQDLVHELVVDLSALKAIGDSVTISKIAAPAGIKILGRSEETVVLAQAPKKEEEAAPATAPADEKAKIGEIKVETEEKKTERAKEKEVKGKEK